MSNLKLLEVAKSDVTLERHENHGLLLQETQ